MADIASAFDVLGGYTPPAIPDSSGIRAALAQNAALHQQQAQQQVQQQPHGLFGGGLGNFLGRIGDALLVANNASPIYAQKLEQQQTEARRQHLGAALANYLGNSNSALAALLKEDPQAGIELYKMTHQQADVPGIAKDVNYYRSIGRNDLADQMLERHAQGAPLIANNGDGTFTIVPQALVHGGGQAAPSVVSDVPTVSDQATYDAVPPGGHYKDPQGNLRTKGGATASTPSPTFR
jgi:hypothetical protein